MKKYTLPASRPVILSGILFIFACNKSNRLPDLANAAQLCPIERVSFSDYQGRDTITFLYDRLGRPVNSIATFVDDGSPYYQFRYDGQGRLKDYIGSIGGSAADFWTRYTYSADNRTIWDTTYTLVEVTTWPPVPPYADIITHIQKIRPGRKSHPDHYPPHPPDSVSGYHHHRDYPEYYL